MDAWPTWRGRELLGREPRAQFEVVVRADDGARVVIRNAPFTRRRHADADALLARRPRPRTQGVARLEADGGVRAAEADVDPAALAAAHRAVRGRARRRHPRSATPARGPFGGVGGTRRGVKCLHAHYAYWLAGGADPVGEWVAARLDCDGRRRRRPVSRR